MAMAGPKPVIMVTICLTINDSSYYLCILGMPQHQDPGADSETKPSEWLAIHSKLNVPQTL